MMPEAARAGRARAGAERAGGSGRLLLFLGASLAMHGLLAVLLLREGVLVPVPGGARLPEAPTTQMIWFEGVGEVPSPGQAPVELRPAAAVASVAPEPERAPERAPRAVTRRRKTAAAPVEKREPVTPRSSGPVQLRQVVQPQVAKDAPEAVAGEASEAVAAVGDSPGEEAPPQALPAPLPDIRPWAVATSALAGAAGEGLGSSGGGASTRSTGTPGSGGAPVNELAAYARRVSASVARQQRYPASAARLGVQGTTRVLIRINRDGSLVGVPQLVRSSGHAALDAEALRMVEAAAPFAPLPEDYPRPTAEIVVPVGFSLRSLR